MQRFHLAQKFLRVIGKFISKDISYILKSKMADGGHLGKLDRFIAQEPFVIEAIIIHVFQLI